MSTHVLQPTKEKAFFVTFTCHKFLSLIEMGNAYQAFYNWFNYLKSKNVSVVGYVIMPNHFHGIFYVPNECDKTINQLVSNGKRFIAKDIITSLKEKNSKILETLQDGVTNIMAKRGNKHRVFKTSFDCKEIFHSKMLHTKLNYIHNNPVRGKWRLSNKSYEYKHSSLSFYKLHTDNEWVTHFSDIG